MQYEIKCSACHKPSSNLLNYKCPSLRSAANVGQNRKFETGQIYRQNHSLWRYAKFFPYVKKSEIITLGEGWTPLVKFTGNIYFKLESLNPTGSFKDRGSTTLISALHKLVKKQKATFPKILQATQEPQWPRTLPAQD